MASDGGLPDGWRRGASVGAETKASPTHDLPSEARVMTAIPSCVPPPTFISSSVCHSIYIFLSTYGEYLRESCLNNSSPSAACLPKVVRRGDPVSGRDHLQQTMRISLTSHRSENNPDVAGDRSELAKQP